MARLVHINGAPATGKTTLASRYVTEHPLALLVDIDALRTQLGHWDRVEESRTLARELALALAERHLASGHDVVIPQYVGRIEFIERLHWSRLDVRGRLREIVLTAEPAVAIERFRRRRAALVASSETHPEADVGDTEVEDVVRDAIDRIADICDRRPATRRVAAGADPLATYQALRDAIHGLPR